MEITQEKLKEMLDSHQKGLESCGVSGERLNLRFENLHRADLRGANLYGAALYRADLRGANLYGADLHEADLRFADLHEADLRFADLHGADLREADLREADLYGADLHGADLYGADMREANLDKAYYQITRIGSRNDTTTYCVDDDNIVCGCWNDYKGGTLAEFKERVESVYGEGGIRPHAKYYAQYMAAIKFFKKMAKLAKEDKR